MLAVWFVLSPLALARAPKGDFLTEEEEDKLREAQDPSARIDVYLELAQVRLDRLARYRGEPRNSPYDVEAFLNKQLDEYLSLNGELKNWINDQAERRRDMRRGLRKVLEISRLQLHQLENIRSAPGAYAAAYATALREAIADLSDLQDGAARALSDQQKQFADLKEEEKEAIRLSKERLKEEKKRSKEEKKLRKQQRRKGVPAEPDSD
jgi:stress response protein YsnF